MKKLLFYLMMLVGLNGYSQTPISIFDPFFEAELIFLGVDTNPTPNGNISYLDAISVTSLSLGNSNIADFTGIQGFTNLTFLDVSDIGFNTLDLTGLTSLNTLYCADNNMSSLILIGCVNLTYVSCYDNALTNLDFSAFPNLQYLNCSSNGLTSLNVAGLSNLFEFYCNENQLTTLNLTGLTDLSKFNCSTNLLSCLDLTNKRDLILMRCTENPNLTCVQVDDVGFASSNSSFTEDAFTTYNLSCPACPTTNPCTTLITPTFNPIAPVCFGTTASPLPATSSNSIGITGTWSPTFSGTLPNTYTFTPDAGQCATTATLVINIALPVTSQFINVSTGIDNLGNALAPYAVDPNWQIANSPNPSGTPARLSEYAIGFWEPTPVASSNAGWINHAGYPAFFIQQAGIYTFERPFTVGTGTTTIDYNINAAYDDELISLEFVRPDGSTSPISLIHGVSHYLLSTSTPNSVFPSTQSGVWKIRAVVNFIDDIGAFLLSGTITVNTDTSIVPTFTQIAPICSGATLSPLPTTSNNSTGGISGTWSPALNNLATTTYTFTPNFGQCATTTTMTIVVNLPLVTIFAQLAGQSFCAGELSAFPFSNVSDNLPNGIAGTWSPAFNNMATTTYIFTPNSGQCATSTSLTVVITPNEVPTFTQIAPICYGATLPALSTTSNNNITGTWSPASNNLVTTTYTFTPDAGQCATSTTLEIIVVSTPDITYLDINVTMTGICSLFNGLYNFDGFLNGKVSYALSTDPSYKISFDGTKWVLWTGNITTDTGFQNTTVPASGFPPTTGWSATQCIGGTLALSFPFYNVTSFCAGATVGDITPTLTNINYYTTEVGGTALASSTPLVAGIYYASQTLNGCESNRAAVLEIVINPIVIPTFAQIAPICAGTVDSPLLLSSLEPITGTWSPVFNSLASTTYTFTPDAGQCATTTTMTVNVIPVTNTQNINVSTGIDNLGNSLAVGTADPNWQISGNSSVPTPIVCNFINGNWQPTPVNSTNAGWINDTGVNSSANSPVNYTFERPFTIAAGTSSFSCNFGLAWDDQLISFELVRPDLTTIPITVVPASNVNLFSSTILNTVTNPMVGTWKIRAIVFFFDRVAGFLLSGNIVISTPSGTVPSFTQIAPICAGTVDSPLLLSSLEPITGTWSPVFNSLATTTYTFTPDAGQCATTTTMTITVLPDQSWYYDGDADGFGSSVDFVILDCVQPLNYVTNNTDCNDNNATVYPGAIEICYDALDNDCDGTIDEGCIPVTSRVIPAQCGMTLATINSTVLATIPSSIPAVTRYRFRVTKLISGIPSTNPADVQVYTPVITSLFPYAFRISQLPLFAYGTTYKIEVSVFYLSVWQPYGVACNVSTPSATSSVISPSCGATLTTMGDRITANIVDDIMLATYFPASPIIKPWRFQVTNLTTLSSIVHYSQLRSFKMIDLPASFVRYGTAYKIEVAFLNRDNTWSTYGLPCTITTPLFPRTQIVPLQCGSTATSGTQLIYAVEIPTGIATVSQYTFRLTNAALSYSRTKDNNLRSFYLNQFPGLLPNTTYNVEVSVKIGSVVGPYGNLCTITTPGVFRTVATTEILNTTIFDVVVYPNPFTDKVNLKIDTPSKEPITINVYDMLGKLLESREITVNISQIELGVNYPSGVYNMIVTQAENTKNVRIIKR